MAYRFNPAPGWPQAPEGWVPPQGWVPEPSWPQAPAGWDFWIEVPDGAPAAPTAALPVAPQHPAPAAPPAQHQAPYQTPQPAAPYQQAPASVPYAQYQHVPVSSGSELGSQPGLVTPARRTNPLVWVLPLVLILVGGIVYAIVALGADDDVKTTKVTAPTASVTPTPTPSPTPSLTPAPSTDAATTPPPVAPTDVPAQDDAAVVQAFCPAAMSLYTGFGQATATATVALFIAIFAPAVAAMPQAAPPATVAEAWTFKHDNDAAMIAALKTGDQAAKPLEAYMAYQVERAIAGDDFVEHETALTDLVSERCY